LRGGGEFRQQPGQRDFEPHIGLADITGGVRRLRIALTGVGKRGGARVIYYFYNEDHPALLLTLYAKNEKADLRAAEKKVIIGLVTELVEQWRKK